MVPFIIDFEGTLSLDKLHIKKPPKYFVSRSNELMTLSSLLKIADRIDDVIGETT